MSSKLTKHNRIKKIGHQIHRKHYITPNNLSSDLADWWNRNNHKKDTSSRGVTTFFAKSVWPIQHLLIVLSSFQDRTVAGLCHHRARHGWHLPSDTLERNMWAAQIQPGGTCHDIHTFWILSTDWVDGRCREVLVQGQNQCVPRTSEYRLQHCDLRRSVLQPRTRAALWIWILCKSCEKK